MNNIMAGTAKGLSIISIVSRQWILFPRFRMMNNGCSKSQLLITILTGEIVSGKALITPFDIKDIITPFFSITEILFGLRAFSSTLFRAIRFIRAVCRAIFSIFIILVCPKGFRTSLTILKETCLYHHYDVVIGVL